MGTIGASGYCEMELQGSLASSSRHGRSLKPVLINRVSSDTKCYSANDHRF